MASDSLNPISPTAVPLPAAALLLSKLGGRTITEAMLQADLAAGAPQNADGTLNLVHYAAWLVKETAHGD